MGKQQNAWQDPGGGLGPCGGRARAARGRYRAFVAAGLPRGRRPEVVGGGLIRSLGSWAAGKAVRPGDARRKREERILGDATFVRAVREASEEQRTRQEKVRRQGYNVEEASRKVIGPRRPLPPNQASSAGGRSERALLLGGAGATGNASRHGPAARPHPAGNQHRRAARRGDRADPGPSAPGGVESYSFMDIPHSPLCAAHCNSACACRSLRAQLNSANNVSHSGSARWSRI